MESFQYLVSMHDKIHKINIYCRSYRIFDQTWFHLGRNKIPLTKVKFVGLFDTVASIGVPGIETFNGYDLSVHPSRIENILHITAMHEHRGLFDLISIRQGPNAPLPPGWVERPFPGVNSDVGGGYGPSQFRVNIPLRPNNGSDATKTASTQTVFYAKDDFLARIAGWIMYDAALGHGAAFRKTIPHPPSPESNQAKFDAMMHPTPSTPIHNPDGFKISPESLSSKTMSVLKKAIVPVPVRIANSIH